jgi:hypothetical protein
MALRYRKSIRLGGGVRLNVSGRGVGWSVGGKGFRYTKPAGRRRAYSTASIPGTGISYRSTGGAAPGSQAPLLDRSQAPAAAGRRPWGRWVLVAAVLLLIAAVPVAGPYLFWVAVAGLAGRRLLRGRRQQDIAARTPSSAAPAWTPPAPTGVLAEQDSLAVAPPPLHQTGLADVEGDADQRHRKAEQLRRQLDELG